MYEIQENRKKMFSLIVLLSIIVLLYTINSLMYGNIKRTNDIFIKRMTISNIIGEI